MSNCSDMCEMNSSHFRKTNPSHCAGMWDYEDDIRAQGRFRWRESVSCTRASERLSTRPPPPDDAPNTNKEKWSGNAAVLRLHSRRRIAGFPAWKPITQLRRNAKKEKKEKKSRGERKRHQSCAGPYWRAQSPSACGGRAAASTPRPSAAGPGPSLPARREPPRSPGPGARTLAARPPAPGWQDVPLGPPDSQLGNTNVRGKRIKLCNQLLVDRGISMTDVAGIFLFTFLVFYMPYNHLR